MQPHDASCSCATDIHLWYLRPPSESLQQRGYDPYTPDAGHPCAFCGEPLTYWRAWQPLPNGPYPVYKAVCDACGVEGGGAPLAFGSTQPATAEEWEQLLKDTYWYGQIAHEQIAAKAADPDERECVDEYRAHYGLPPLE